MKNFAVIENNIVINVIVCESKEISEQITGKECIEYTEENAAQINGTWDGIRFWREQPFFSWIKGKYDWEAPIQKPDSGFWVWNEDLLNWEEPIV